ncbi:MAG: hypothetical protein ABIO70_23615 [Pseudomonadota bacterium]
MSAPNSPPLPPPPPRKEIVASAVLAGICALSPVPFVDDLVIGAIRRRLVRRLFRARGVTLSWPQQRALTRTGSNWLLGCLGALVIYPIKKIFRKIFYVFAVKEAVDVASRLLHQGLLVEHALERGCIQAGELGDQREPLERLNRIIRETCDETDTSPVGQILKRSFAGGRVFLRRLGRQVVRQLRAHGLLRRARETDALPDGIGGDRERGLMADLRGALLGEEDYFQALHERFDRRWAGAPPVDRPPR